MFLVKRGIAQPEQLMKVGMNEMFETHYEPLLTAITYSVNAILTSSSLNSFEKPKRAIISFREMTVQNECITPSMKVRRNFARKHFEQECSDLYRNVKNKWIIELK